MEARRRVAAQCFDEPRGRARWRELVSVVDHEHEIRRELLMQHLRKLRGERIGAEKLLELGTACAFREPAHVAWDVWHSQPECVAELPSQCWQVDVVLVGGVPGAWCLLPP